MSSEELSTEVLAPRGVTRLDTVTCVSALELFTSTWSRSQREPQAHILLLHGLGGNSITWHAVAPRLALELDAKVIAIDLPGFGATRPGKPAVTLNALVDVCLGVLDAHGPREAGWFILGNSLGGMLALLLAEHAPERLSGVSLAAGALPALWGRSPMQVLQLFSLVPPLVPILGRRLFARYFTTTGLPGVVDDPVDALFAEPRRLSPILRERLLALSAYRLTWAPEAARAYEQTLRDLARALLGTRGRRAIEQVGCPVQVLYGTRDPLYPMPCWNRLRRQRPDWTYVPIADTGHVPQLESPALVTLHVVEWLRALGVG